MKLRRKRADSTRAKRKIRKLSHGEQNEDDGLHCCDYDSHRASRGNERFCLKLNDLEENYCELSSRDTVSQTVSVPPFLEYSAVRIILNFIYSYRERVQWAAREVGPRRLAETTFGEPRVA